MVNSRKPKELILRISLDDAGGYGLSTENPAKSVSSIDRLSFAEGAFARLSARSWAPATTAATGQDAAENAPDDPEMNRYLYRWGGALATVLSRQRARYGGDVDQFLIHLIFVLARLDALNAAATARAKGAQAVIVRPVALNMQSVADITAIPRESVRRKLAALCEAGFLARTDDGFYTLGAATDLTEFFELLSAVIWGSATPRPS